MINSPISREFSLAIMIMRVGRSDSTDCQCAGRRRFAFEGVVHKEPEK
jgi:hypothetical protein